MKILSGIFYTFVRPNQEPLRKRSGCCNTDENRIEQCFAAHIVHGCQQYWTILLHPIQAQQYCSIVLTSVNNVGGKTLFNPVEQLACAQTIEQRARRFLPCSRNRTCGPEQVGNLSEHARRKSIWRHILGVFREFIWF
jgi:hypothetical protein